MALNVPRTVSTAFQDHESTRIGRQLADRAAGHPGRSGFAILRHGRPAFTARVAMADLAERSLDVQYYIWEADATGRILADRLVRAADRGVRVRMLLDDMNLSGRDGRIAALDAHPNIEIRLFNPFVHRRQRGLDFLTDLSRVNHRMHNKVMVMDNAVALVGGRNVGAHYFGADAESNFRDLDVATVGPLVREISSVFDTFWNGEWSVPMAGLAGRSFTDEDHRAAVAVMRAEIEEEPYPFPLDLDEAQLLGQLNGIADDLVWADGRIVWDDPAGIYEGFRSGRINEWLQARMKRIERELLVESAYFIARKGGVELARELAKRGVRMRVLTNSMASNDVLAAHAGYSRYRRPLIDAGVELYELRPDPGRVPGPDTPARPHAALHTKAIVFDRRDVFIGSFNLDPRSAAINTEAGLYIESPELARQVVDYMDEGVSPRRAYRIAHERGRLRWLLEADGRRVQNVRDPHSTRLQRFLAGVIRSLPVEQQL